MSQQVTGITAGYQELLHRPSPQRRDAGLEPPPQRGAPAPSLPPEENSLLLPYRREGRRGDPGKTLPAALQGKTPLTRVPPRRRGRGRGVYRRLRHRALPPANPTPRASPA